MSSRLITLTTDFGLSDHYVGVVKGVILGVNRDAEVVDICHLIEPYDLLGGAITLAASCRFFPPGTVHLVVIDPGVGTARRPLLVQAGPWWFVAPDNGVLELIYQQHPHRIWALRAEEFALQPLSNTFHGRDVFAPAAALISKGTPPEQIGDPTEHVERLHIPRPRLGANGVRQAAVLKVDRFGNLITNLDPSDLPATFVLHVGESRVTVLRPSYGAAAPGEIFAIAGSSGYLEVSMNQASAAEATGACAGSPIELVGNGSTE